MQRQLVVLLLCLRLLVSHPASTTRLQQLSTAALEAPSDADNWLLLGLAVQAHDHRSAGHALWCYERALRTDPTSAAAALKRADLVAQSLFWRHRAAVWPQLRQLGARP